MEITIGFKIQMRLQKSRMNESSIFWFCAPVCLVKSTSMLWKTPLQPNSIPIPFLPYSLITTNTQIRTEQKSKPLSRNVIINLQVSHPHKRNHHSHSIALQPRLQHIPHFAHPVPPILGIPNIPPIPEKLPSNSDLPIPAIPAREAHRHAHRRASLASQQVSARTPAIYLSSPIPRFHLPERSGAPPRLVHTRGYSARLPLTPVSPFLPKKTRS